MVKDYDKKFYSQVKSAFRFCPFPPSNPLHLLLIPSENHNIPLTSNILHSAGTNDSLLLLTTPLLIRGNCGGARGLFCWPLSMFG